MFYIAIVVVVAIVLLGGPEWTPKNGTPVPVVQRVLAIVVGCISALALMTVHLVLMGMNLVRDMLGEGRRHPGTKGGN